MHLPQTSMCLVSLVCACVCVVLCVCCVCVCVDDVCVGVHGCICVRPPPRTLITSGVILCDIDHVSFSALYKNRCTKLVTQYMLFILTHMW